MQEALDVVRREMGAEAVILHTRELPAPRFWKFGRSKDRVEITAGTGVNVRSPRIVVQTPPTATNVQPPARPQRMTGGNGRVGGDARHAADQQLAPPPPLLTGQRSAPASQHARDLGLESFARAVASPTVHVEQQAAIARQLTSIQKMVEKLSRGGGPGGEDVPSELFQLYTELIDAEVDEDLARDWICRLKQDCPSERLGLPAVVRQRLSLMVEGELRCAPPISAQPGRRKVVALVGPTGVGKTTTIAKLAANFRLRDGIKMGLVTVDTYRIAAVEQLRTYAEIIDLPMKVVTGPREMRRALDELSGLDLVLIDTAGRSPRDELKIQELKSLLAEARVDEVHLVLSLVASPRSLEATASQFAAAGATAMILTKLDEAVGMGAIMSVARRVPLPISYLTTGQDVPDDIEHAQPGRIARLVMGDERLYAPKTPAIALRAA